MSKIVNNEILYPTHKVVVPMDKHREDPDLVLELHFKLSDNGGPERHRRELMCAEGLSGLCWSIVPNLSTVTKEESK